MVKKDFKRATLESPGKDHPSLRKNKELYQITETTLLAEYQQKQNVKWLAQRKYCYNQDVTNSKTILGRKRPTIVERAIKYRLNVDLQKAFLPKKI